MISQLTKPLLSLVVSVISLSALAVDYVQSPPMTQFITTSVGSCSSGGTTQVPLITWGGDEATILANGNNVRTQSGSIFANQGLDLKLVREDVFANQVKAYVKCESPYLRGTIGMIMSAAEVANRDPRTRLVQIYKITWSGAQPGEKWGGDVLVVKKHVKSIADIRTIAINAYGPHVDFGVAIFDAEGKSLDQVNVKWTKDLVGLDGSSPGAAFYSDSSVDAAFVILPDALALTSNGTIGTGGEDSVEGARIFMSSKSASRVISDEYYVRADYLQSHRKEVEKFVHGLMLGEERLAEVMQDSSSSIYQEIMTASADILLDDPEAIPDAEGLYLGAEFVGYPGNVDYVSNPNDLRNREHMTEETQSALIALGLLSGKVAVDHARWDYNALKAGLTNTVGVVVPKFDAAKVAALVAAKQQQGTLEAGELFSFEVFFAAKQDSFPADLYSGQFKRVLDLVAKFNGAVLVIEGHSDPNAYLARKKEGRPIAILNRMKAGLRNMSLTRATNLRDSLVAYAKGENLSIDPSQFTVAGYGVMKPNTPNCTYDSRGDIALSCKASSRAQWEQLNGNRRVRFSLIQVETESSEWE